jgi:hypothetical protein
MEICDTAAPIDPSGVQSGALVGIGVPPLHEGLATPSERSKEDRSHARS